VGGAGADRLNGGGGNDEYRFKQGDSPTVVFAHGPSSVSATAGNTGDTFTFAAGADVITANGFDVTGANGDKIVFNSDGPNITNSNPMSFIPGSGLVTDQQYFVVRGDFVGNTFTVNTGAGADSLVVYDGDQSSNVTQTGLVIQGVAPSLLVQQWGQIYHV
jgi:Ca2+-binding RTX toxin-like protein